MNLSELFIRRPVMTILLNAAIVVAGVIAYSRIPVAALPSYNTPVINVSATLPGASPETMATSVALQLEKQFQTIPGLNVISSTNTLGNTSITLEFDEGRNIDAAAVDVQAALLRAQRQLPQDMTQPPAYRKVNPPERSYVATLLKAGLPKIGAKITEEAAEVVSAAAEPGPDGRTHLIHEVADLLFHTLVLLGHQDLPWSDVEAELARRFGISGIDEKESRRRG